MATKVRIDKILKLKQMGQKIVMVTAYDFPTGRMADEAGVDLVLVGDSLGMAALGYDDTIPVTLEDMIHHTKAVRRGVKRAFLVADMPFMTYRISAEEALRNAGHLIQDAGAEAVKLEGGAEICPTIHRITEAGIPVMGHIGYTMQSIHALSGAKIQGKQPDQVRKLVEDAKALEEAGCFAIVVEVVPWGVGAKITQALTIPTIGIGAGAECDGQVLVQNDLVGITEREFKHCKRYVEAGKIIRDAISEYAAEVRNGSFPAQEHGFLLKEEKDI
jgi:3-methyl-2-oxobutanoate hydroxymethyltransferase